MAGEGANAITAAFDMINAVKGLEIIWNERAKEHPNFKDVVHPLNFNPDSLLGVPGIMDVYRSGGITIANAPGTCNAGFKSPPLNA